MICFRDMTFCAFYEDCKKSTTCERALTPKVKADAERWWGSKRAPIAQFADKPQCFEDIPVITDWFCEGCGATSKKQQCLGCRKP